MGTAYTSIIGDASALFYNPAATAFLSGTQLQMDSLVVVGSFRFKPSETPPGTVVPEKGFSGAIRPRVIPVGNLYFVHALSPKWTLGFGSFTPFGLSDNFTNFRDDDPANTKYPGRFAGTRGRLEVIWMQPTVAYRLSRNSSVGVGVALVHTHLFLEQSFLNPLDDGLDFGREVAAEALPGVDKEQAARFLARLLPEGRSRVAGTANSPGFSLSYLYRHVKSSTNIGLMFRSAVTHHLKGEAAFAFTKSYPLEKFVGSDLLPKAFPNQPVTGSFTTPGTFALGISNSSHWNTTLSMDVRMQDYRRFRSVALNFSQTRATNPDVRTPAEKRLVFDFADAYALAFGAEKRLSPITQVRLGYMYDHSPVIDKSVGPLFPDTNRHSFTFGASRKWRSFDLTLFYQAVKFAHRDVNVAANSNQFTNGRYDNFAHIAGLGFCWGKQSEEERR